MKLQNKNLLINKITQTTKQKMKGTVINPKVEKIKMNLKINYLRIIMTKVDALHKIIS